jgi:hypothetical protein
MALAMARHESRGAGVWTNAKLRLPRRRVAGIDDRSSRSQRGCTLHKWKEMKFSSGRFGRTTPKSRSKSSDRGVSDKGIEPAVTLQRGHEGRERPQVFWNELARQRHEQARHIWPIVEQGYCSSYRCSLDNYLPSRRPRRFPATPHGIPEKLPRRSSRNGALHEASGGRQGRRTGTVRTFWTPRQADTMRSKCMDN